MNGPLRGSGSPSSLKITASVPKTEGAEREGVTQKSAWRSGFYRRKGTFISSGPEIPERGEGGAVRGEKMVGLEVCVGGGVGVGGCVYMCVCMCVYCVVCVYVVYVYMYCEGCVWVWVYIYVVCGVCGECICV